MTSTMERPRIEIKINPDVMDIKWGDVVFVDFTDNSRDSEQSGIRPAIIIQNDKGNEHSPTTIVASYRPIHTKSKMKKKRKKSLDKHKFVCYNKL